MNKEYIFYGLLSGLGAVGVAVATKVVICYLEEKKVICNGK